MGAFDVAAIGDGLAFAAAVPEAEAALSKEGARVVVTAPPGSGKTTLVPVVAANVVDSAGRVVVVSPRRLTARAGATRLAHLTGTRPGELAGYTVRGDRVWSRGAVVEFVTPGVLLRRLLGDPELTGTAAVVFDEVHERGLDSDLALAMSVDVAELRGDLRLAAMSATLDTRRFARVLAGESAHVATVVAETHQHPLDVEWAPFARPRTDERGVRPSFLDHVATRAVSALDAPEAGDVLVFVPGAREVKAVVSAATARVPAGVDVTPLHGRLPSADQDRALAPAKAGRRRIVVSTPVAESSLTVPGVRVVVDSGLAREPRLDLGRGMSGLVTVASSRESATQRAGRATRLGPGRVIRCYAEADHARAREHTTPEMATADLTQAALILAAWGTPRGQGLRLPSPPPGPGIADAERTLAGLGAVDEDGRITKRGRRMVAMPLDPRLARGLLDGAPVVGPRLAAQVVAALADDDPRPETDLVLRVAELSRSCTRAHAREVARLEALAAEGGQGGAGGEDTAGAVGSGVRGPGAASTGAVGFVVALAYPGQVARRVGEGPTYLLASGTRAALPPEAVARLGDAEWLAVAEASRSDGRAASGTGAVIRSAARLSEDDARLAAAALARDDTRVTYADGRLTARRVRALGAIERSSTPRSLRNADAALLAAASTALREALVEGSLQLLPWTDSERSLRRRLALLRNRLKGPWPDVTDAGLLTREAEWLPSVVTELAAGRSGRLDAGLLRALVPWPEAGRIDELAPESLPVASGRKVKLSYPEVGEEDSGRVVIAGKLQEMFGMSTSPSIVEGRDRIQFHLLSPAGRTLAVTDDLASFWNGPYQQVRAEMRARYPKHPWPTDPWNAPATRHTARRGR